MTANNKNNIVVLGGAGYIGSHACHELEQQGYTPVIIDNFSKGRIQLCSDFITKKIDILDTPALEKAFSLYKPLAVMHFAALSEIGESIEKPDSYLHNNVDGTSSVICAMKNANIDNLIFSSTAAVYGLNKTGTFSEKDETSPVNPYGLSKLKAERLIMNSGIRAIIFRYFNAAGAWPDKNIGEWHVPETHLIPLILQAALGQKKSIKVFGRDYRTKDGSCIRDFVHVRDIAHAHILGLKSLLNNGKTDVYNLGCNKGYSVLEIIEKCKAITNVNFMVENASKREGDPPILISSNKKIKKTLKWQPRYNLEDMISSAWLWHQGLIKNDNKIS